MKIFVITIATVLALGAGTAFGQPGYLGLFSDSTPYLVCEMQDRQAGVATVYVVHKLTTGAAASRFRVIPGDGATLTYLTETSPFVAAGNSQDGVCIEYGGCLSPEFLVLTITYFGQGTSATCSWLEVVADPHSPSGQIEIMGCDDIVYIGLGRRLYINNDGSCDCWACGPAAETAVQSVVLRPAAGGARNLCPVSPVAHESWGHIKALYD